MKHNKQHAIKKYCRKVRKRLVCTRTTKNHLLSSLYEELTDTAVDCHTYKDLVSQVGTPLEIARQLQNTVSDQECEKALTRTKIIRWATVSAIILLFLFIAAAALSYAYYLWHTIPTKVVNIVEELPIE